MRIRNFIRTSLRTASQLGKVSRRASLAMICLRERGWEISVPTLTGPFTRLPNEVEVADITHTGADGAAFVSTQARRVSAAAAATVAIPGTHVPQAAVVSLGARLVGLTASSVQ
jgi:hypothetical protein